MKKADKKVTSEKPRLDSTSKHFVVVRDGYRVSEDVYESADDPKAVSERDFWRRVAKKSRNEPVEIVPYNPKVHKV